MAMVLVNGTLRIQPDIAIFVRGDSNSDEALDVSDPVFTLAFLFLGGPAPACLDAADANDDGILNISDPVATLGFLYLGARIPALLRPEPGVDLTPDGLGCRE